MAGCDADADAIERVCGASGGQCSRTERGETEKRGETDREEHRRKTEGDGLMGSGTDWLRGKIGSLGALYKGKKEIREIEK